MRSGGQLLVESLIALGATKTFGVPGESYLAVLDALHDTPGRLDYVLCRNEGGASFMASAYGKLTGSPGICFVTRGPGAANASIGVHTAMQDSSPMVLFVGQVGTGMRGREAFQEVDYRAVFGSLAKWAVEVDKVARLPEILARAWTTALGGRPGPVVVALPEDMLAARTDIGLLRKPAMVFEPAAEAGSIAQVRAMLGNAERPVLLIGGANWSSEGRAALQQFAESSDIPVVAAFRYQDQFDNNSPVFVGEAGVGMAAHVKTLLRDADVILAVNVRFGEMTTDGYTLLAVPQPHQQLIHVHGSDREIGKIYIPAIGIQAGPNAFAKDSVAGARRLVGLARRRPTVIRERLQRTGSAGPGRYGRGLRLAARQPAGRCHRHQWRRKLHRLAEQVPSVRTEGSLARTPVRGDGLRPAGRDRGEGSASTAARRLLCRRRRFPDELPRAWHGDAGRRPADRPGREQRHLWNHPRPPGAQLPGPGLGHDAAQS